MEVRIGIAPDSWGVWFPSDPKQPPWQQFLDEVVEAGYEWVELGPYGYLPTDLPTLRAELEGRGLRASAAYVGGALEDPAAWPEFAAQVRSVGERLAALGAPYMVLSGSIYTDAFTGERVRPSTLSESAWDHMIEATHKAADIVHSEFGLELVFHPHADGYVEYEDQIERFLEDTDPERVALCLDTGHHAFRGADPVSFMRRHQARIPYLHIKDVDAEVMKKVEAEGLTFVSAVRQGAVCEPAEGLIDFPALVGLLREIAFDGWAVVEQDMYPVPFDKPLPIARRTRAYLREIGMG
jgi:inosose dehydratase